MGAQRERNLANIRYGAAQEGYLGAKRGEYAKPKAGGCFERVDDVCSTAYWYQPLPTQPFPELPDRALRTLDLPSD